MQSYSSVGHNTMDGKTGQIAVKQLIREQATIFVQFDVIFFYCCLHLPGKAEPEIKAKQRVILLGVT